MASKLTLLFVALALACVCLRLQQHFTQAPSRSDPNLHKKRPLSAILQPWPDVLRRSQRRTKGRVLLLNEPGSGLAEPVS
ncbi:hypothetical protein FOCC_FOCC013158 [Frankliniella occidentalis]|nr:hypothetical protein FOCC_FOCC013158 [Frankliniella occidentalis]